MDGLWSLDVGQLSNSGEDHGNKHGPVVEVTEGGAGDSPFLYSQPRLQPPEPPSLPFPPSFPLLSRKGQHLEARTFLLQPDHSNGTARQSREGKNQSG